MSIDAKIIDVAQNMLSPTGLLPLAQACCDIESREAAVVVQDKINEFANDNMEATTDELVTLATASRLLRESGLLP